MTRTEFPIRVTLFPDQEEQVPVRFLDDAGTEWWMDRLRQRPGVTVETIGYSRAGRPLYGIRVGKGPLRASITAGAHADEPAGPIAACLLAWYMSSGTPWAQVDSESYSLYVCPQVNPDGSQANSAWFAAVPDIRTYLDNVKRELPGDDIEFGYPGEGKGALRPENEAVANFLLPAAPFDFHASLHSMATAEGAWLLIEKHWADRTSRLQSAFSHLANGLGFKLHDIQRNGDKGFTRIARGFCTTPTSTAMRQHFLDRGEPEMAAKFHLSSMEFVRSLGGDPLAIVTEIPAFAINHGWTNGKVTWSDFHTPAPEPGTTAYEKCRAELGEKLAAGDIDGAVAVADKYDAAPVPFAIHCTLQLNTVLRAMREHRDHLRGKPDATGPSTSNG